MKIQEINDGNTYEQNKKALKKKKRRRRLAVFKFIMTLVVTVTLLVLLALSPVFNIRRITVSGNVHYTEEEIKDASGIPLGNNGFKTIGKSLENILALRDGAAENKLKNSCSYIKEVKARFSVPGTIKIEILERNPVGYIRYMGANLVVDNQGYVLDTVKSASKTSLPIIKGIDFKSYKIGQALKIKQEKGFENAIALIDTVSETDKNDGSFKLMKLVDYIDAGDPENISMSIDGRIVANLGDLQNLKYRLDFLKEILLHKGEQGYLDFTDGRNPYLKQSK